MCVCCLVGLSSFLAVFLHFCLSLVVLPCAFLLLGGTTASGAWYYRFKRYCRPPARYYRCEAGAGGYIGGRGSFLLPHTHSLAPTLFVSPATGAAGGLRWISFSGAFLSISFVGDDPHLVLLPWMPVLPPFPLSSCLDFQSSILGAVVVASLDFWPNLGLSRMEKASRQFGLVFARSIFEFGRTVVPDLTTAVGNCCFPVSSGTTLSPERYYRSLWSGTTAWNGTAAHRSRYYRPLPVSTMLLPLSDVFACVLWLMLVLSGCLCVLVCGSR